MEKTVKTYLITGLIASMCLPTQVMAAHEVIAPEQPAAVQQAKIVKGHVVDENGEPLIGVTVKVVGANGGAITDVDGNFTLNVPEGRKLQISYAGYKSQTVTASRGNLDIKMEPDAVGLDDLVVIGYGTQK